MPVTNDTTSSTQNISLQYATVQSSDLHRTEMPRGLLSAEYQGKLMLLLYDQGWQVERIMLWIRAKVLKYIKLNRIGYNPLKILLQRNTKGAVKHLEKAM